VSGRHRVAPVTRREGRTRLGFRHDGCIVCRIVVGDLPSDRVAESELSIAIRDLNAAAPIHALAGPRPTEGRML
jgi:hypothetical protein